MSAHGALPATAGLGSRVPAPVTTPARESGEAAIAVSQVSRATRGCRRRARRCISRTPTRVHGTLCARAAHVPRRVPGRGAARGHARSSLPPSERFPRWVPGLPGALSSPRAPDPPVSAVTGFEDSAGRFSSTCDSKSGFATSNAVSGPLGLNGPMIESETHPAREPCASPAILCPRVLGGPC